MCTIYAQTRRSSNSDITCSIRLILAFSFFIGLLCIGGPAQGQNPQLLEVSTGRTQGLFAKEEVTQRAALFKSGKTSGIALLVFRGWPGIANLEQATDGLRSLNFMQSQVESFLNNGISLVVVDCPTDERAMRDRFNPMACDDGYRSSQKHAQDVIKIIAKLKEEHRLHEIYLFGHSYGTISSKWLALNLGSDIKGSIHSAAQTVGGGGNYTAFANSAMRIDLKSIKTPMLHIHHLNDRCRITPYSTVKDYAEGNIVTVRGGKTNGDPCGGTHYHSYEGRESEASSAIIKWIQTREVLQFSGED